MVVTAILHSAFGWREGACMFPDERGKALLDGGFITRFHDQQLPTASKMGSGDELSRNPTIGIACWTWAGTGTTTRLLSVMMKSRRRMRSPDGSTNGRPKRRPEHHRSHHMIDAADIRE
jgi:hypothetical protein